ncbi:phosphotriesterase-related protein [Arsenicitalea aurantiaca]|uniref:Phosphotriesterase-related protein n=1 Tax=Arsenicitalea aurantiaca TaxID=1783274 RepID=A0A433X843_9HYPH|nr:phosphotriesterase-related protein [Arsenicitalea aurantiaca]RUT30235.1 phosphotriesterase-related protein [Arsenicitalea aurantiaca]
MIIRTVLGDIAPETLGLTLGHEHVYAVPPEDVADPDLRLDDPTKAEDELSRFKAVGGGALIEMTTVDYGRDLETLADLSLRSGVHIVAATGYNKGKFADRLSAARSTAEIADWMASDVANGAGPRKIRCGVIKASSSLDGPGENEARVFEAAAIAHLRTNAPISTHTEKGTWAIGQVELLARHGVAPDRILLGHLDLKPDLPYLREVAATGAYFGFDQFAKAKYLPDAERVRLIVELFAAGAGPQILIAGDMARRSYHEAWGGGPGFAHIPRTIVPALRAAGLGEGDIDLLLRDNPRRFLAFTPA